MVPLVTATAAAYLPTEYLPVTTMLAFPLVRGVTSMFSAVSRIPVAERLRRLAGLTPQRSIVLEADNALYTKFEAYLIKHHLDRFRDCQLAPRRGDVAFSLANALLLGPIQIQHGQLAIVVSLNTPPQESKENEKRVRGTNDAHGTGLRLSSSGPLSALRDFVAEVCQRQERENSQLLRVYHSAHKGSKKKESRPCWEELEIITNRNLSNTIVDAAVQEHLVDDVREFLSSETWYNEKGIPYKRGYLLHGPPGTGKTSIVKALAVEYGLPIFALDLATIKDNAEFKELITEIAYLSRGQRYILSLEDVDRADLFSQWPQNRKLTRDCFLNVIDGIAESFGRLLFLSANNVEPLHRVQALMRPGRVDKTIEMTFVTVSQFNAMLAHFYQRAFQLEAVPNNLSPAKIINVLQRWPTDADSAIEQLLQEPSPEEKRNAAVDGAPRRVGRAGSDPLSRSKQKLRRVNGLIAHAAKLQNKAGKLEEKKQRIEAQVKRLAEREKTKKAKERERAAKEKKRLAQQLARVKKAASSGKK